MLQGISQDIKKNIEVKDDKNYYYGKKRKKSRKKGREKSFCWQNKIYKTDL